MRRAFAVVAVFAIAAPVHAVDLASYIRGLVDVTDRCEKREYVRSTIPLRVGTVDYRVSVRHNGDLEVTCEYTPEGSYTRVTWCVPEDATSTPCTVYAATSSDSVAIMRAVQDAKRNPRTRAGQGYSYQNQPPYGYAPYYSQPYGYYMHPYGGPVYAWSSPYPVYDHYYLPEGDTVRKIYDIAYSPKIPASTVAPESPDTRVIDTRAGRGWMDEVPPPRDASGMSQEERDEMRDLLAGLQPQAGHTTFAEVDPSQMGPYRVNGVWNENLRQSDNVEFRPSPYSHEWDHMRFYEYGYLNATAETGVYEDMMFVPQFTSPEHALWDHIDFNNVEQVGVTGTDIIPSTPEFYDPAVGTDFGGWDDVHSFDFF